jgi:hypothetical protein
MVAIINAIVGGSVFFCEKVGFEKGGQNRVTVPSFWVPQMGPGTPKSCFCRGSSENIQFFHDLAFWGKSQFFEITRPEKEGLLRSQGRPECPYINRICKISDFFKFFWCWCFWKKITKTMGQRYQEPLRSPRWPPMESLWPMDLAGFSVFRKS